MFCCWLAVQHDQLANWESFSESRELLSHHCSLAGCTRGLGRHQTGNSQQVEAMDVYLAPFIKPQKPDREIRTQIVKQGCPNLELHAATTGRQSHHGLDLGLTVPDWGWSPPPNARLHSSFLTVFKESGFELILLCQVVTLKKSDFQVFIRLQEQ